MFTKFSDLRITSSERSLRGHDNVKRLTLQYLNIALKVTGVHYQYYVQVGQKSDTSRTLRYIVREVSLFGPPCIAYYLLSA